MERILVALDASPRAAGVLHAADALARRTGAKLLLFRAVGLPTELPPEALGMPPGDVGELMRKNAERYLTRCAEEVPPEHRLGVRAAIGTPWQSICDAAKSEKCDLIVIGSHGYGVVDRLLGTTAAKVVNHAERSVLVVRSPNVLD